MRKWANPFIFINVIMSSREGVHFTWVNDNAFLANDMLERNLEQRGGRFDIERTPLQYKILHTQHVIHMEK